MTLKRNKKKFQKKINSIFKLKRVGLKVNKSNDSYYLTLGGYEEGTRTTSSGNGVYSYETEKSVRFILDKKFSINNRISEYHPLKKLKHFERIPFITSVKFLEKALKLPKRECQLERFNLSSRINTTTLIMTKRQTITLLENSIR